jgi:type II secretory pathway predicted ATPase ExeA
MSASLRPLRSHQERALEALRGSLAAGNRRPMLQAPTGFGKTLTAAHIIQRALDKGTAPIISIAAITPSTLTAGEPVMAALQRPSSPPSSPRRPPRLLRS